MWDVTPIALVPSAVLPGLDLPFILPGSGKCPRHNVMITADGKGMRMMKELAIDYNEPGKTVLIIWNGCFALCCKAVATLFLILNRMMMIIIISVIPITQSLNSLKIHPSVSYCHGKVITTRDMHDNPRKKTHLSCMCYDRRITTSRWNHLRALFGILMTRPCFQRRLCAHTLNPVWVWEGISLGGESGIYEIIQMVLDFRHVRIASCLRLW